MSFAHILNLNDKTQCRAFHCKFLSFLLESRSLLFVDLCSVLKLVCVFESVIDIVVFSVVLPLTAEAVDKESDSTGREDSDNDQDNAHDASCLFRCLALSITFAIASTIGGLIATTTTTPM